MKKIYSFVLMAAMLFVGTSAWAVERTVGTGGDFSTLAAAVNAANSGDVIKLVSPVTENATGATQVWINKDLTLNLQNFMYLYKGAKPVFIGITSGSLTIKGSGTLQADAITEDLIRIYGSYEKINAKTQTPAAKLVIEEGATIQSNKNAISIDVMREKQPAKFGREEADFAYSCNFFEHSGAAGYGVANGVMVEIAGQVLAYKYGIKCNGTVRNGKEYANMSPLHYEKAAQTGSYTVDANNDENYSPYIHVATTGNILTTDVTYGKAVAVYASGYARWLIEGTCTGSSGVYVKSGDVDIMGATVSSNFTGAYDPILSTENTASGVLGAGSAVAVESNQNYSGDIDVAIGADATLTAGTGYALEESVAASTGTKVDAISVEGATFKAGTTSAGAITISETTSEAAANPSDPATIIVTSAEVTGSITIGDPGQGSATLNDFTSTSAVLQPTDPLNPNQGATTIIPLDIQLTSDGYASFSAPINLFKAKNKSGYKAFGIYTGVLNGDVLELSEVGYVEANKGVILYCSGEKKDIKCYFTTSGNKDNYNSYGSNDLKSSSDWENQVNKNQIYCLRKLGEQNTMFYRYTGDFMPENKAYLDLSEINNNNNNNAPQRIRMVVAQEEQTEAIESVEAASVKAVKFVENGEILIRRGENVYNLQGQIVK